MLSSCISYYQNEYWIVTTTKDLQKFIQEIIKTTKTLANRVKCMWSGITQA